MKKVKKKDMEMEKKMTRRSTDEGGGEWQEGEMEMEKKMTRTLTMIKMHDDE